MNRLGRRHLAFPVVVEVDSRWATPRSCYLCRFQLWQNSAFSSRITRRSQRVQKVSDTNGAYGFLAATAASLWRSGRCDAPVHPSISHLPVRDLPLPPTPAASGCIKAARFSPGRALSSKLGTTHSFFITIPTDRFVPIIRIFFSQIFVKRKRNEPSARGLARIPPEQLASSLDIRVGN